MFTDWLRGVGGGGSAPNGGWHVCSCPVANQLPFRITIYLVLTKWNKQHAKRFGGAAAVVKYKSAADQYVGGYQTEDLAFVKIKF